MYETTTWVKSVYVNYGDDGVWEGRGKLWFLGDWMFAGHRLQASGEFGQTITVITD